MKREEFDQFVNMMEQAKNVKGSMYKDFINTSHTSLSCAYFKQNRLSKGMYSTTKIHISEWIKDYMFEVRVTIHRDGERRKGVVPLEQNTLEHHRISAKVIDFTEVEQEAIAMAQKLGWL